MRVEADCKMVVHSKAAAVGSLLKFRLRFYVVQHDAASRQKTIT